MVVAGCGVGVSTLALRGRRFLRTAKSKSSLNWMHIFFLHFFCRQEVLLRQHGGPVLPLRLLQVQARLRVHRLRALRIPQMRKKKGASLEDKSSSQKRHLLFLWRNCRCYVACAQKTRGFNCQYFFRFAFGFYCRKSAIECKKTSLLSSPLEDSAFDRCGRNKNGFAFHCATHFHFLEILVFFPPLLYELKSKEEIPFRPPYIIHLAAKNGRKRREGTKKKKEGRGRGNADP